MRYFILTSHYRSPLNYAEDQLEQAKATLTRFYTALRDVTPTHAPWQDDKDYGARFREAMEDDFNTPLALAILAEVRQALNKADKDAEGYLAGLLVSIGAELGLLQQTADTFLLGDGDDSEILALIEQRNTARAEKNWAAADAARDSLTAMDIVIEDGADGTSWRRV